MVGRPRTIGGTGSEAVTHGRRAGDAAARELGGFHLVPSHVHVRVPEVHRPCRNTTLLNQTPTPSGLSITNFCNSRVSYGGTRPLRLAEPAASTHTPPGGIREPVVLPSRRSQPDLWAGTRSAGHVAQLPARLNQPDPSGAFSSFAAPSSRSRSPCPGKLSRAASRNPPSPLEVLDPNF